MSAIASSNSLGLVATSLPLINSAAGPNTGGSGEQLAVNIVNGNLVLQRQDELLVSKGLDTAVLRTYNSQGVTDGDNNDNWRIGFYRSLRSLAGTIGAANSSIVRVAADGAELIYRWNGSTYVNTDGDGSYDTLSHDANTSRWTWTDGDSRVTETYDWINGSGKLLSEKDMSMSDNVVSYTYQPSGLLQQVLNASGEKTHLDYTGSNLTRIRIERTDGSISSRVSYGYDTSNRLQTVTVDLTPDNAQDNTTYTTSYTYDGASKRVRTVAQSDGSVISMSYDASSRVTSITDALGNITRYTYGTGKTTVTDALGNDTVYLYDANGRLGSITAPATGGVSSIQQFSYNSNGDIVTITDGEGRRVVMQYDGNGNQTLQRDEAGNTVTRTFDSGNRLLTETAYLTPDPDGADPTHANTAGAPGTPLTTRYAYDTSGRLRFVISPEGRVTEHQYNTAGQRLRSMEYLAGVYSAVTVTEPELTTWASTTSKAQLQRTDMEYDFRGQLSKTTTYSAVDSAGNPSGAAVTTYVYDQAGRLLSTIAPLGGNAQKTTYTYDGLDRLLATVNGLGQTTIYSYDDVGNRTTLTAANGLKTLSTYDKAGRLVTVQQLDVTNADLGTSRYYYDNNHQLRMTEDATGVRTWLLYDAAGRRNGEVDGTGSLTEYVYDRNGQVTQTIRYATPVRAMFSPVMNAEIFTIPNLGYPTLSAVGMTDTANGSATLVGAFTTSTFGVENATKASPLNVADPNWFAMRFTGGINVFAAGDYTFYTRSDDGSNLYINGVLQVANDYAQAATTRSNTVNLGVGSHSLVETYYEWGSLNTNEFGLMLDSGEVKVEQLVQIDKLRPAASASDQKTWNAYDSANRLVKQVAANGAVTEFQYDGQSRLVRTIEYANPIDSANLGSAPTAAAIAPIADPQNDRVSRNFHDNDGLLRATLDGEGYLVENSYNNLGQLWKTTAYANVTTATLRANGSLNDLRPGTSTDDITSYTLYDAEGDVVAEIDGEGYLTEHAHDANGNETQTCRYAIPLTATVLGSITATTTLDSVRPAANSADQVESATYDALNRVVTSTNAQGTVTFREYDNVGNVTSITAAHGTLEARTTGMTYDLLGRLIVGTDARGNTVLQAYDKAGRLLRATDENGNITRYYYDQDGRQVYVVNALGEVQGNTYDALGQLVTETRYGTRIAAATLATVQGGLADASINNLVAGIANNAFDSKTIHTYNKDGTLASSADALGNLTFYSYNAFGEQRGVTVPIATGNSLTSTFAYDRRGLLRSTSADASGINATSTQVHDAFGRVVQSTDARGNSSSSKYDRLGRQVRVTDALGAIQSTTYDAFDRVLSQTDALGNVTTTSYDSANRTTTMTTPESVTVRTSTNRHGEVVSVVDGRGSTVTYTYDFNGNLTQTDLPLQRSGKQVFDRANRLIETTDERGIRTVLDYDAADRVLTRTVDPSTTSPAYTGLNLVTRYEYDALGRQTRTIDPGGVATVTEYDLEGQVTRQIVDDGTGKLNLTTTTTYDQRGKTLTVTDPGGTKTQFKYDKLGRRTEEVVDPAGLALKTAYGYDKNDNVLIKTVSNPAGDSITRYAYDANHQLVYTIDPLGYVRENTYDGENQLTQIRLYARPISIPNLTVTSINGGSQPAAGITTVPTLSIADIQQALAARADPQSAADSVERRQYDKDGRLAWTVDAIGAVTRYQYDANGNLVKKTAYANPISPTALATSVIEDASRDQVTLNVYDAANRLSYTIDGLGAVTGYDYDASGNIVKKTAYGLTITPKTLTVSFGKNIVSNGSTPTTRTISVPALPATVIQKTELILSDVVANAGIPVMSVISPTTGVLTPTETSDPGWVQSSLKNEIRVSLSGSTTLAATSISNEASPGMVTPNPYILTVPNLSNNGGNVTLSLSETYNNKKYDGTELDDATFGEVRLNLVYAIADYSAASIAIFVARDASRDQVTQYSYDAANRQTRTTYPTVGIYSGESSAALLANGATGPASRVETSSALYTQAYYDASGNVVANRDAAGNMRYQAYDAVGQIRYAVDGEGYVTGYVRDSLGNVTALTRYADKIADAIRAAWGSNSPPLATIAALLTNNSANRTITTEYDALGRAVKITEPSIYAYDGTTAFTASPVTRQTYNALGQITQTQVTKDNSAWLTTYRYYDQRGLEVATIDALRNVTTQRYDAFGNVIERTEYANPLGAAVSIGTIGYTLPGASDKDRTTRFSYDQNNRRVSETRVNVEYSGGTTTNGVTLYADANYQGASKSFGAGLYSASDLGIGNDTLSSIKVAAGWQVTLYEHGGFSGGTKVITADNATITDFNDKTSSIAITASSRGDLTSTYQYDAFGNLIRATDAGNNSMTTYYDQANRTRAVTQATRAISGNASFTGLTEFARDSFGNVTQQIERANGATNVTLSNYSTSSNSSDRSTGVLYDSWGRVVQTTDALGNTQSMSYDANGNLAKQWQSVNDSDGLTRTSFKALKYDKLGQLVNAIEPGSYGVTIFSDSNYQGNSRSFTAGDYNLIQLGIGNDALSSLSMKQGWAVTLYADSNFSGTSKTITGNTASLPDFNDQTSSMRITAPIQLAVNNTQMRYNAFGELISKGIVGNDVMWPRELRADQSIASANGRYQLIMQADGNLVIYDLQNNRQPIWSAGTFNSSGSRFVFQGSDGNLVIYNAANMAVWNAGSQNDSESKGGFLRLQNDGNLVLYNANGSRAIWNSKAGLNNTAVTIQGDAQSEYFDYNNGGQLWRSNSGDGVSKVMLYDLQGNLTAEIRSATTDLKTTQSSAASVNALTGTRRAQNTFDALGRLTQQKLTNGATLNQTFDRWGNRLSISDARDASRITEYTYNASNQLIQEVKPTIHALKNDLSGYADQSPITQYFYDYAGNQVAVRDARGNVNRKSYDVMGNAIQELNADGGIIQHAYNAFGNEVQRTDAMSNVTQYEYNKLGQINKIIRPSAEYYQLISGSDDGASAEAQAPVTLYYDSNYGGKIRYFGEGTWEGLAKEISSLKIRAGWKVTLYDDDSGIDGGAQNQDYTTNQASLPSDLNDDVKKISVVRVAGRTGRTEAASAPGITMTYDALGRQLSKTDGNGNTQYTFDASGNVVNIRLPGDITTINQYDASNRKITEINANSDLATWNYDYFGRLISKRDIGGASYSYAYDYAGQLIRESNSRGRDVTTTYETSGQVKKIEDKTSASARRTTEYEYNASGQHTIERVSIDGIGYSDQELRYDSLGQLAYAGKPNADIYYQYDLIGNRVKITNFIDQDTIYFYAYDAMNRQIMVDGVTNNDVDDSANYNSSSGRRITYDKNGNRISDVMQNSTERYSYDALNRLYKATKNDVTLRYIRFDQAGRELEVYENSLSGQTDMNAYTNVYDTAGRLVRQYFRNDSTIDQNNGIGWGKDSAAMFNTYDRVGNITKSTRQLYGIDQWTTTSDYGYAKFDSYKQNQITSTRSDNTGNPGKITLTYDLNGHLVNVDDEDKDENDRSFVNNADGQILQKTQQSKTLRNFVVNGQVLGTYGTGIDQDKPPVVSKVKVAITLYVITQVDVGSTSEFHITFKAGDKQEYTQINDVANDSQHYSTVMGVSWPPVGGNLEVSVSGVEHDGSSANDALPTASFTLSAASWTREGQEFISATVENGHAKYYIKFKIFTDLGTVNYNDTVKNFSTYQIVDAANSGAGSSNYRVGAGDSLQSIAQGAYGDAALWYLIADANGLSSNSTLQVGTMLTLPNAVGTVHNNANTFKPYNSSNIIGDTSPYLVEPPGISKCQQIGTIIAAVLAAVVISVLAATATVFTLGAAGVPALSGAGIAIAAIIGAVGGAVGSAASQGIMIAGGLQEHFSWSDVGVGAATGLVTGAIMGGVGGAGKAAAEAARNLQRLGFAQKMLIASLKCVGSNGISYATVAQSAVIKGAGFAAMSMVNSALGQGIKIAAGEQKSFQWSQVAAGAVTGAFSGASGAAGGVIGGIVGDLGGATLGNFITNGGKFDAMQFVGEVAGSMGGAVMGGMMERICFAVGTPVHTEQGLKPIESFIGGEMVLTRHEQTGEIAYRRVARTFVTPEQKIFRLVVVDAEERTETLRTTAEHPFWIKDRGWMKAGMLKAGDVLIGRSDETVTVYSAALETTMETVYNIEVEDFHTYHVGKAGVWVHNTCEGVIGKVERFLKKPRNSRADFNMLPESCIESTEFILQTQQSGREGMRYGEKADPVYMLFKHPTEEKTVYFDLSNDADIQDHAQGLRDYLIDKELPGIGEGIALLNRTDSDFRDAGSYNMHLGAVLKRNEKSAWISDMTAFVESDFPMREVEKINITKAGDFRGNLYKSHEKYAMGLVTNNLPQNAVHWMPPDLQSAPPAKRQKK